MKNNHDKISELIIKMIILLIVIPIIFWWYNYSLNNANNIRIVPPFKNYQFNIEVDWGNAKLRELIFYYDIDTEEGDINFTAVGKSKPNFTLRETLSPSKSQFASPPSADKYCPARL